MARRRLRLRRRLRRRRRPRPRLRLGARVLKAGPRSAALRQPRAHSVLPLGIVVGHAVVWRPLAKEAHTPQQPQPVVHDAGHGERAPHEARGRREAVRCVPHRRRACLTRGSRPPQRCARRVGLCNACVAPLMLETHAEDAVARRLQDGERVPQVGHAPRHARPRHAIILEAEDVWGSAAAAAEPGVVGGVEEALVGRVVEQLVQLRAALHEVVEHVALAAVVQPHQLIPHRLRLEVEHSCRVGRLQVGNACDAGAHAGEEGDAELGRVLGEARALRKGPRHPSPCEARAHGAPCWLSY